MDRTPTNYVLLGMDGVSQIGAYIIISVHRRRIVVANYCEANQQSDELARVVSLDGKCLIVATYALASDFLVEEISENKSMNIK